MPILEIETITIIFKFTHYFKKLFIMKKIVILFCLLNQLYVYGQEKATVSRFNLKISPQHLLFFPQQWGLKNEYVFKNLRNSLVADYYLIKSDKVFNINSPSGVLNAESSEEFGIGVGLSYRYYPFGFSPIRTSMQKGFYISPLLHYEYLSVKFNKLAYRKQITDVNGNLIGHDANPQTQEINSMQYGFILGYQWIWWKSFVFDIYGGIGYRSSHSKLSDAEKAYYPAAYSGITKFSDRAYSGILPKLGFQIGFAF